ncbi:alpha/beta hydrolase [Kibdelosporangium phytohabitans]|uniref:Aminopeptidase n=1 Tax=Kibdelosporangium phytohabitans TaxID=860235 RepID=A0A0N9I4P5_9PSEU|nr:alpha/beta hydrolase [Kibdelosporangium phytohabitans]ALG10605.1 aminopeptidase [Kibdelosporangium phytohabitans]MBE1461718.1 pimeloyl-ACP methyl ester carboxylesterase [Kibdelosporangium phytohabitans]
MRKFLTLGLTTLLAAGAAAAVGTAAHAGSQLEFGACPADVAQVYAKLKCATVNVPLDYSRPFGARIDVLVTKHASTNPAKRRGVLFVNPGGPANSAVMAAGKLTHPSPSGHTRMPAEVLAAYDVIGIDSRGTGHSQPLSCVGDDYWSELQPDPDRPEERDKSWERWKAFAKSCADKNGDVLKHTGSRNVIKDMDHVRTLLGEEKISYLGYSYGTYLGSAYAQTYPQRIDRMILDSTMNPVDQQMWYDNSTGQVVAGVARQRTYLEWIAKYDNVFHLGKTHDEVNAAWQKLLGDFRQRPRGPRKNVGAVELMDVYIANLSHELYWEPLAKAMADYVLRGDETAVLDWATPGGGAAGERMIAGMISIACVDSDAPSDRAKIERDFTELARTSDFAWYNVSIPSACANWHAGHDQRIVPSGRNLPPILMFGTEGDSATPYVNTVAMHKQLPSSVLVTERGSGTHCVFGAHQSMVNWDAQRIGGDYLVNGVLPNGDTDIAPHPLPVPTPATAAAARPAVLSPQS